MITQNNFRMTKDALFSYLEKIGIKKVDGRFVNNPEYHKRIRWITGNAFTADDKDIIILTPPESIVTIAKDGKRICELLKV